jgi:hypothetical protein
MCVAQRQFEFILYEFREEPSAKFIISTGSIGAGFYQSNDNTFTGNSFNNNTKQVVPNLDFSSPNLVSSSAYSQNIWDDDNIGNYWSDYNGKGDYFIDANNVDHYPLVQQPNPSPNVPEMSWLVIVPLLCSLFSVAVLIRYLKGMLIKKRWLFFCGNSLFCRESNEID